MSLRDHAKISMRSQILFTELLFLQVTFDVLKEGLHGLNMSESKSRLYSAWYCLKIQLKKHVPAKPDSADLLLDKIQSSGNLFLLCRVGRDKLSPR